MTNHLPRYKAFRFQYLLLIVLAIFVSCSRSVEVAEEAGNDVEVVVPETSETETSEAKAAEPNILYASEVDDRNWLQRRIAPPDDVSELSKELLVSTIWVGGSNDGPRIYFAFFSDNIVLGGSHQSTIAFRGSYRVAENRVIIQPIEADDWFSDWVLTEEEFQLIFDPNYMGPFLRTRLSSEELTVDMQPGGVLTEEGEVLTLQGKDVRIVRRDVVVVNNLSFRRGPGTNFERDEYIYHDNRFIINGRQRAPRYFVPGHQLRVYAEAIQEETIQGATGRWLFVGMPTFGGDWTKYGWVFGAHTASFGSDQGQRMVAQFQANLNQAAATIASNYSYGRVIFDPPDRILRFNDEGVRRNENTAQGQRAAIFSLPINNVDVRMEPFSAHVGFIDVIDLFTITVSFSTRVQVQNERNYNVVNVVTDDIVLGIRLNQDESFSLSMLEYTNNSLKYDFNIPIGSSREDVTELLGPPDYYSDEVFIYLSPNLQQINVAFQNELVSRVQFIVWDGE